MNLTDIRLAIFDKMTGNDKKEKSVIKDLLRQPDNYIFEGKVNNGTVVITIKKGDQ